MKFQEGGNSGDDRNEDKIMEPFVDTGTVSPTERGGARALPPDPQSKTRKVAWLAVILSIFSIVISAVGCYLIYAIIQEKKAIDNPSTPDINYIMPDEGDYIDYQGFKIPVKEDVPLNSYDARGFFYDDNGYMRYELNGQEAILGIDVSYHQKLINWEEVAEAGIEFAMIRVGRRGYGEEGTLGMDELYVENITGALRNGIKVGVYFFSQATNLWEVDEEVVMLLSLIEPYDITYPVVFDWEFVPGVEYARTNFVTGQEITTMTKYFCEQVENAGYQPMVYLNLDFGYLYLDLSELKQYPIWLAELNLRPRFYYHFDMWQYSFTGVVPGIEGDVDMNLSFRDFDAEFREKQ